MDQQQFAQFMSAMTQLQQGMVTATQQIQANLGNTTNVQQQQQDFQRQEQTLTHEERKTKVFEKLMQRTDTFKGEKFIEWKFRVDMAAKSLDANVAEFLDWAEKEDE